jgi:hypothetical protein
VQTFGIFVLAVIGFIVFRFLAKANNMRHTINEVMNTSNKFKMTIQIVRQKAGDAVAPGPMTAKKETYIAYLYEVGRAQSVADNLPETMCQAFVMQEARDISNLPEEGDSKALMQSCRASSNGALGTKMGKIDGEKLADRNSSQPYFVEFDMWVAQ